MAVCVLCGLGLCAYCLIECTQKKTFLFVTGQLGTILIEFILYTWYFNQTPILKCSVEIKSVNHSNKRNCTAIKTKHIATLEKTSSKEPDNWDFRFLAQKGVSSCKKTTYLANSRKLLAY